jgi:hypothetical protein
MARQMLFVHWKAVRWGLLPLLLAAFALPLLSVQGLGGGGSAPDADLFGYRLMEMGAVWRPVFPLLAAAVGTVLALSAWVWDHHTGHVYALSLPVARWRYASLKFGTGAAFMLLPVGAFAAGAALATASVELPAGLVAYPGTLTLRFLAATLTVYGLFFAMASGTIRTVAIVLAVGIGTLVFGNQALGFVAQFVPGMDAEAVTTAVLRSITAWPSPFRIFTGNWMLFDV